ncbi:MAG: adenylate/guanylate cyclase domain-containing protein [Deltaproteobacteria bacterium]|nr:adenylate/guanylate cyclase domain-containing protein [Deltaproteobacteria bacterium]
MAFNNKNPVVKAIMTNGIGFVIAIIALIVPDLENKPIDPVSYEYFYDESGSLSIADVMRLPATSWQAGATRSLPETLSRPAVTWTKTVIKDLRATTADSYVASNNHPMHRSLDFYLVEHGLIVKASNLQTQQSESYQSGVFEFNQPQANDAKLYLRSVILGTTAPAPRILSASSYADEQRRISIFVGFVIGSALAVAMFNLLTAMMLRKSSQAMYGLYYLATAYVAMSASGFLDRIYPDFMYDINRYSLFSSWAVIVAIFAIEAFRAKSEEFVDRDKKTSRHLNSKYLAMTAVSLVLVSAISPSMRPLLLSFIMIGFLIFVQITPYADRDSRIPQLLRMGLSCGFFAVTVSILSWYHVLRPSIVRNLFFEVGSLLSCFFNASIPALMSMELARDDAKILRRLRQRAISGTSPEAKDDPARVVDQEEHQIVTMFIDIAAFSQLAAPLPSESVFDALSERLNNIADIVREFGGNIDRSLGDGLLCFFGYQSQFSAAFNTQRAFLAARKIQESTIMQVLNDLDQGQKKLIMPVRVGIHSSSMIIGNLGGATRIDFTMIGAGVNFASRLETACTPFKVMFSDVCFGHLVELGYAADEFAPVAIHIKHRADSVTAYEFDPFRQRIEELRRAERAYLEQLGIKVIDQRLAVRELGTIVLRSGNEEFVVRDFSSFGFRGVSVRQFGRQSRLIVEVRVNDQALHEELRAKFVDKLTVEVRWSQRSTPHKQRLASGQSEGATHAFEHGFKIIGISPEQRRFLFERLSRRFAVVGSDDVDGVAKEVA